ncbi:hypothetical protein J5277_29915 [Rhizobium sp. 16-449-1b]|uniref:hypothetical protein n=1 Tax=Rhizobium sp. 16-449-1b TaxID=2819989 RepID=UPI001ADD36B8|nr:hypothetical protein [Rhizobium sp. 16-449-1b]MBO9198345.1 hypothetical protein [Rhizobium sp. 16-449-1b]
MLMSLISLSDDEIETVTSAVREWCHLNHCDIDSSQGRHAITIAVELVHAKHEKPFLDCLIEALRSPFESQPATSGEMINHAGPVTPPTV